VPDPSCSPWSPQWGNKSRAGRGSGPCGHPPRPACGSRGARPNSTWTGSPVGQSSRSATPLFRKGGPPFLPASSSRSILYFSFSAAALSFLYFRYTSTHSPRTITPTATSAPITALCHVGRPVSTPSSSYTQLLTTVYITFLHACRIYFT